MTVAATLPSSNTSTSPTPGYRWPAGEPAWQQADLEQLASAGELGGVPPQILAGISYYTSDYGLEGVGINSAGHGGYFGQGATWSYPGGTTPRSLLLSSGTTAFESEAKIAASTLASYGKTPTSDLNEYATGTPKASNDFTTWLEQNVFPGANATLTSLPWWTGIGAIQGAGGAVAGAIGSAIFPSVAELVLIGLGGVLIVLGLFKAAAPNAHPVIHAAEAAPAVAA